MDVDAFRQSHLSLVSGSTNCTGGHDWIWRSLGQCLERTEQTLGFVCGILAVFLWTAGHVTIYKLQRQHARVERICNIRIFLTVQWFSDVLGCIGAGLAQQLATQIIFSLSAVFVSTVCSAHYLLLPLTAKRKTFIAHRKGRTLPASLIKCLFPLIAVLPLLSLVETVPVSIVTMGETVFVPNTQPFVPALWIAGYTMGSLAGLLYCGVKLVDICDSYFMSDYNMFIGMAYGSSILAELSYVASVCTQSQSLGFFYHSLPWTLPRLVSAGIDCGILIQRLLQKRRTKGRKLSQEGTACLLSSDTEYADVSSSDSEEVIWMPLKTIELPQHPVTTSRVQIISDSDGLSDKVEYLCDSGQFSMSETGGFCTDQDLMLTDNPVDGDPDGTPMEDNQNGKACNDSANNNQQSISDSNETSTTSSEDEGNDEGKTVLERQISNLSTVSSEEKIAIWIQSTRDDGKEMIVQSDS